MAARSWWTAPVVCGATAVVAFLTGHDGWAFLLLTVASLDVCFEITDRWRAG